MNVKHVLLFFVLFGFLSACHDKTVEPATESETDKWILEQMKYWYYWNDKIPANPNVSLEPEAFFESLLYKYNATTNPEGDRFSWIQESADELKAGLSGESKSTGMDYKLYYYPKGSSNVVGVVLYSLPDSPAAKAGIKRGDVFTGVNGQALTGANYSQLLNAEGVLTFSLGSITDDGVISESTVKKEVTPIVLQEDPVYFDTLFQYGSNKIGYIVYHQFFPSPNGSNSNQYDLKLDQVFANFKANNVNSLILDLRYNGGGYVSSSTNLASLIGKVTSNDIFYYKEYNSTVTPVLKKQFGEAYFYDKFKAKTQNIGSSLNHFIVLTSGNTASASELLINGLKPFMNVTLVGAKTYGKNVGSITISDDSKKIKWGLQPIVTKSLNSQHQSDYYVGFTPDFPVTESMKLYPYGNPKDPLLGEALYQIVGARVVRKMPQETARILENASEIESSITKKAGGSNMFYDK
ncbi:S41 family peptidase [Dyadobacter sp. NIV53]|uniref:S41 family peptidase n=1 Tax=Dyadobacter sp. NIV53 TaxID=2861765 RepID=UPI001C8761F6|nr:S41 family peptidase [Dyadobacter sp. NIV53]